MPNEKNKNLVIGIGNEYRSDDGIGVYVARKIEEKNFPNIEVKEESGEGASLIDLWSNYENVIIVDAVSSKAKPGTIYKINPQEENLQSDFFHYSTHAFSLAEALELSKALNNLPKYTLIFGIEGSNYNSGTEITEEVKESGNKVIKMIEEEIKCMKCH